MDQATGALLKADFTNDLTMELTPPPVTLNHPQILADALCSEGQLHLLKGSLERGLQFFEDALTLDPSNPKMYYSQGLSLFEHGTETAKVKVLLLANKKFKKAISLDAEIFDSWFLWATTLLHLGEMTKEYHYYIEAKEKFQKALSLSSREKNDTLIDLHWNYGKVLAKIAIHSGEAFDWQNAIDSFHKASLIPGILPFEFWIDQGKAYLELYKKIPDLKICVKSIQSIKQSLSMSSSHAEGWKLLAQGLNHLYQFSHDEDHYSQANDCFAAAAHLNPQDARHWLDWAKFLCCAGKRTENIKKLRASIEKCHHAYACNSSIVETLAVWSEALAALGVQTERLDLLSEAHNKISQAAEIAPDNPDIWHAYGICLESYGHYFNDIDYYYQAIEKFQEGLSLDRTHHKLWHSIGYTYTSVGLLEQDQNALEKALRFYSKALNLASHCCYYLYDYAYVLSKLGESLQCQKWLELSILNFERLFSIQKNALYTHPDWLFYFARTLDLIGEYHDEPSYYTRSIEILSHVLMVNPDFPSIHYQIALAFSHLGELTGENEQFYRALHHYRLAAKHEEENDQVLLDLGINLINIAVHSQEKEENEICLREAEIKLMQSAKLGNTHAYYHIACLYSLSGQIDKSLHYLEKASNFDSLPPQDEILNDEWLEALRLHIDIQEFLSRNDRKENIQEEK